MDEGLKIATKKIEEVLQSEELRLYHKIQLEKMVRENEKIKTEERIKKGIQKGIEEEKIRFAINLKKDGISVEKIARFTGLNIEFIEEL